MWKISNEDLLRQCNQESKATILVRRRCYGLDMCLEGIKITRTALYWTPEGKRKRGRPKNIWKRTV